MTESEQKAVELLLSEPEIVAWLGADPSEDERRRLHESDDRGTPTAGSAPRRTPA
jgi:hypothetical protein